MKRKDERLDQRLGDFGPLHQPIDEIAVERLLDRYGISLVMDYPQLLFERREQFLMPGWRHRETAAQYPNLNNDPFDYLADSGRTYRPHEFARYTTPSRGNTLDCRLSEAYRILDELYAPVPRDRTMPISMPTNAPTTTYRPPSGYTHHAGNGSGRTARGTSGGTSGGGGGYL